MVYPFSLALKGINCWHMQWLRWIFSVLCLILKKPNKTKGCILFDSTYVIFLKLQNWKMKNWSVVSRVRIKDVWLLKG